MKNLRIERNALESEQLHEDAKKLGTDLTFYYDYVSDHSYEVSYTPDRDHDEIRRARVVLTLGKDTSLVLESTNENPYTLHLNSTPIGYYGRYSGASSENLTDLIEAAIVSDYCYHKLSRMIGNTENTKYALYLKNLKTLKTYGQYPDVSEYFTTEELDKMHERAMAYAAVAYDKVKQEHLEKDIRYKVLKEMSASVHDESNIRTIMKKLNLGYLPGNYTLYPQSVPAKDENFKFYHAFENNIISSRVFMAREVGDYPQTYEAYQLVLACGKKSRIFINTANSFMYNSKYYDAPLTIEVNGKTLKFNTLSGVHLSSLHCAISRYEYCANKIKFMPDSMAKQTKYYVAMQKIEKALDALKKGSVREINGFQDNILNDEERYEIKKASQAAACIERLQEKGVKIKPNASLNEIYAVLTKKERKQQKAIAKNTEKYAKLKLAKQQKSNESDKADELVK